MTGDPCGRGGRRAENLANALRVVVSNSPAELGARAGVQAAKAIREALAQRGVARLMLAAAPSQEQTLQVLAAQPHIDWRAVTCFHMDEYLGLDTGAPQAFGNWLQAKFLDLLAEPPVFHRISGRTSPSGTVAEYEKLMGDKPFDVVLLGIGVNGHLAFNDPPADLDDPHSARIVRIDDVSRQQQVDEGHFAALTDVPYDAVTVTIPRLLNARVVIASVPGASKRRAVAEALEMPVSGACPATALRTHPAATMYLDTESAPPAFTPAST